MKNKISLILFSAAILIILSENLYSQVLDFDGNIYQTVKIGNQEWTVENLNVSHYRNGDTIIQIDDAVRWEHNVGGAWCYYKMGDFNFYNNPYEIVLPYGKLYNWYVVNDEHGLAPEGWHVPNDAEWTQLTDFLGGEKVAGKKMKSKTGWLENKLATNESGFNGIPGGMCDKDGSFYDINKFGCFWSSSENSDVFAWYRFLIYNFSDVARFDGAKERGLSVRCIKD